MSRDYSREEILSMEVGREMDALVAEKVMGWRRGRKEYGEMTWLTGETRYSGRLSTPEYSTDIKKSWEVVEKIKTMNDISIHSDNSENNGYHVMITEYGTVRRLAKVFAETAPLAISRAALLAVME